ncbi:hypothetical protein SAMD00019534_124150, partial [Acytostelium subglobosum LB1]|uniref:hypothetical protein n=1 Tax=Acytostelium subglobosum LB1 TaxID=1410327 RepID=UPI000644F767
HKDDSNIFVNKRVIKMDKYPTKKQPKTLASAKYTKKRDAFVTQLLSKMSIVEKIGQMTQLDIGMITKPDSMELNTTALEFITSTYKVGSFLNTPFAPGRLENNTLYSMNTTTWMDHLKTIQEASIKNSPNKIPMLYGLDSMHGANYIHGSTLFPHNNGLAATFNPELARRSAMVTAKDTSAVGIPWAFAPVLDCGMNPLWPRFYETFGEDPHLAATMGAAATKGLQGGVDPSRGPIKRPSVVGSAKHFFGYSDPRSGKDRTPAWIPDVMLRRYFLPSFAAAINEGLGTVMVNSGEVNGRPMHATKKYLTDLLQDELEFEGLIVTDWEDIIKLVYYHHVASNHYEAIIMALDAGIDMSMVPLDYSFPILLKELVDYGVVPESRLDRSVRKILNTKYAVGLFDNPYPDPKNPFLPTVGGAADRSLAAAIVAESITLLKNDKKTLPLKAGSLNNLFITGPSAHSLKNQNGGWSVHWQGAIYDNEFPFGKTILDGVKSNLNSSKVTYSLGAQFGVKNETMLKEAAKYASLADASIVVIGELPEAETPGNINDLTMDQSCTDLLEVVVQASKGPVILIIIESRPRLMDPDLINKVDAVVAAYLPGSEAGQPIADILFGKINPSGRLPFTYPARSGDIGVPYYHKYSEVDATAPLFQFGTGLSYTTFNYSLVSVTADKVGPKNNNYTSKLGDSVSVTLDITNTGSVQGKHTVLCYLSDVYAETTPEVKLLKAYTKVDLGPKQTKRVKLTLDTFDFSFIDPDSKVTLESGLFIINIGDIQLYLTMK